MVQGEKSDGILASLCPGLVERGYQEDGYEGTEDQHQRRREERGPHQVGESDHQRA